MADNKATEISEKPRKIAAKKILRVTAIMWLTFISGYIHHKYVSGLFENQSNFSHLSELEREMLLRTEMGFYYSYYKTLVEERPFMAGITKLLNDQLVEYPKNVNAFNRFNIYPEVLIGAMYCYLEPWLNTTTFKQCHIVERGDGLSRVQSCVGIGQPIYFYLEAVWWLAGLLVGVVFLYATLLSESMLGGVLAVAQYFANHASATRVQWAPNERENLAVPLLLVQALLVTLQLREKEKKSAFQLQVSVFLVNCLCLLFWQFSQFVFLTQTAIFFMMEQLRIIDLKTLCVFLHSHFCGLHMAILLLQGNDMLETSLYTAVFLVVSVYSMVFSSFRVEVKNRVTLLGEAWLVVLRVAIVITSSLYVKTILTMIMEVDEDSHIWDLLYSKLSDYNNFHTKLYTCTDAFGYLPWKNVVSMNKTFLLPLVLLVIFNIVNKWTRSGFHSKREETVVEDDDSGIENSELKTDLDNVEKIRTGEEDKFVEFLKNMSIDATVFYNVSQMVVFGVMATLVMRVSCLFVPQACVVASLATNYSYYKYPKRVMRYIPYLPLVLLLPFYQQLTHNLSREMSHVGEYSNVPLEQLLNWISSEGGGGAFAGSLPTLAAVLLSARRPVVAHPHYEHADARQRAYSVYKTYGRFPPTELYQELTRLEASYLIVEDDHCYGRSNLGCSFEEIWDAEAPELRARPRLCHALLSERVDHFYMVFTNRKYAVFRVHDLSVRYMPRSFDT